MLDYDREAAVYDETRGGEPRAISAAGAILSLLPSWATTLLDVACGTGSVTAHLSRPGLTAYGADASPGMARYASSRLPGRVIVADCRRLPYPDGSFDAVTAVWLLHLIDDVDGMLAEAARVLRPGGTAIITVDKDAGHDVGSHIDALLAPYRIRAATDAYDVVRALAARHGLDMAGETRFTGNGQGRSPRSAAAGIRSRHFRSAIRIAPDRVESLATALERLPDPDSVRPDPRYRLIALSRTPHPAATRDRRRSWWRWRASPANGQPTP